MTGRQKTRSGLFLAILTLSMQSPIPSLASAESTLAINAYQKGNLPEAEKHFLLLVSKEPKNARAAYYLAMVHIKQKKTDLARREFKLVIERFPDSEEANLSADAIKIIEGRQQNASQNAASISPVVPTRPSAKSDTSDPDADYQRAVQQADEIRRSAAQHAQYYKDKANQNADEMKQVVAGKRYPSRVYSDADVQNANSELMQQAQRIIEAGEREANEVLKAAEARRK